MRRARNRIRSLTWGVPALLLVAVVTFPWWPGWYWSWRTDNPVRRGARLAVREGCLSCHMPRGTAEIANPGSRWGTVPSFFRGNAMMYVKSPDDIAFYIAEGHAPGVPRPPESSREGGAQPFRMKAFKGRLSEGEIRDLAAFVLAADALQVPPEGPVARGQEISAKFGCESCHGIAGSGGVRNPRSLTGAVPGWTGADFDHLSSGRTEFGEWVRDGRSVRMRNDRLASIFLDRANLQMPAFRGVLKEGDVDDLWAYVLWLRSTRSAPLEMNLKGSARPENK
jgi:mono/diheme cytochrome c family protein